MMTPEFRRQLRAGLAASEAKRGIQSVTLPTLRAKRKERKLQQLYRRRLIDQTAMILRKGSPSVFAFEGFMTNGLRAGLCLRGWSWPEAHKAACEIVRLAFAQIGAKRPTVQMGQPEYAQPGVIVFERTRCVQCGGRLEGEQKRYCSKRCAGAWLMAMSSRFACEQIEALTDED